MLIFRLAFFSVSTNSGSFALLFDITIRELVCASIEQC